MYYDAASATDSQKNTYLVGATVNINGNYDILVTKYDVQGIEQWSQQVDGIVGGNDYATDVLIDSNENIIVTGAIENGAAGNYDLWIRKYNPNGSIEWTDEYNGQGNSYDGGTCLTIDEFDNVYVGGGTFTSSGTIDFLMIKYNSLGIQQWMSTWDHVGLYDMVVRMKYRNGSLSVAGGAQISASSWKFATLRVNTSLGSVSVSNVSGGGNEGIDQVRDLFIDDNNNSYVVGGIENLGQGYDFKLIKLSSSLDVVWEKEFNGQDNLDDFIEAVKVDELGNVFITGYSTSNSSDRDIITRKYSSTGILQWSSTYNGSNDGLDHGKGLTLGSGGEVYVVATSYIGSSTDILTLKYSSTGSLDWKIAYNGEANRDEEAMNIILDDDNDIIIVGQTEHFQSTRYVTIKYSEKSIVIPPDEEEIPVSQSFQVNAGQLLSSDGSQASSILFYNTKDWPSVFFQDNVLSYVTAKLDSLGQDSIQRVDLRFNKANPNIRTYPLSKNERYNNYYLGHIGEGRERVENYQRLFSPDVWNKIDIMYSNNNKGLKYYLICHPGFSTTDLRWEYMGQSGLVVNSLGELEIITEFGNLIQPKAEVYEIDDSGVRIDLSWQPSYTISANSVNLSVGSFNTSNVLVLEFDQGQSVGSPPLDGNLEWSSYIGTGVQDMFYDVKTDELNNSIICGETRSPSFPGITGTAQLSYAGDSDAIIFKLNSDLEPQWGTYYGGGVSFDFEPAHDKAKALDLDQGQIFVTGITFSKDFPVEYGGMYQDDNSECDSPLCRDAWLMRLKDSGERVWATCYGDKTSDEQGLDVVINNNYVYAVGSGGPTTLLSNEMYSTGEGLIMKFNLQGEREMVSLFPVTEITAIQEDQFGNYFMTGKTEDYLPVLNNDPFFTNSGSYGLGNHDAFLAKFSSTDVLQMSEYIGSSNYDVGIEIEVDSENNVIVGGYQWGDNTFGNPSMAHIQGSGYFQATQSSGNEELWLMKTNNDGEVIWSTYYGSGLPDWLTALSIDNYDNILFGGYTMGSGIISGEDLPAPDQNPVNAWVQDGNQSGAWGRAEGYFTMMNANGNLLWFTYFGGNWHEDIGGSTVSSDDKYYIVGRTSTLNNTLGLGELGFPTEQYNMTEGSLDWWQLSEGENIGLPFYGFGARFDINPSVITSITQSSQEYSNITVFPNPANESFTLVSGEYISEIEIFNVQGKIVWVSSNLLASSMNIDMTTWGSGLYLIQVTTLNGVSNHKLIKR